MSQEHVDVLIVGAGISGIDAAYHVQKSCPDKSYAILEGREAIGGTWDLFRYPGIRSDSDMYTLGFPFRPWTHPKAIADGDDILEYLNGAVTEYGIDKHIRFRHRAERASWSSETSRWTVDARRSDTGEVARITCNFLFMCTGYYDYAEGYTPTFPGVERFAGKIVHPQKWTSDVDYADKRVVIIGSGATAVTLVPAMARSAAHVTMLQRSPTYVVARPDADAIADGFRRYLPTRLAYALARWKNILLGMFFFSMCKRSPERIKGWILEGVRQMLPPGYDVEKHFTPSYKPWDQRICLVPHGDLFRSIRKGRATVVTDTIETFTEKGIALASGEQLEADLIVTATGLNLQFVSDIELTVDGKRADVSQSMLYKGMLLSDVPNLTVSLGYTNASWTLKCDLTSKYATRLINHMAAHGFTQCRARLNDPEVGEESALALSSGYVQRAVGRFPKQGTKAPWKLYQNYVLDLFSLGFGSVRDPAIEFTSAGAAPHAPGGAPQEAPSA